MTDTRELCPSVEKCNPTAVFVLFLIENRWPFILSRRLQPVSPTYTASMPGLTFSSRTSTFGGTLTCRLCPTGDRRTSVTSLSHRAVLLVLRGPRLTALSRVKRPDVRLARQCTTWTPLIVKSPTKFVGTLHVLPARWCT